LGFKKAAVSIVPATITSPGAGDVNAKTMGLITMSKSVVVRIVLADDDDATLNCNWYAFAGIERGRTKLSSERLETSVDTALVRSTVAPPVVGSKRTVSAPEQSFGNHLRGSDAPGTVTRAIPEEAGAGSSREMEGSEDGTRENPTDVAAVRGAEMERTRRLQRDAATYPNGSTAPNAHVYVAVKRLGMSTVSTSVSSPVTLSVHTRSIAPAVPTLPEEVHVTMAVWEAP
jgi:hypothetical protein